MLYNIEGGPDCGCFQATKWARKRGPGKLSLLRQPIPTVHGNRLVFFAKFSGP